MPAFVAEGGARRQRRPGVGCVDRWPRPMPGTRDGRARRAIAALRAPSAAAGARAAWTAVGPPHRARRGGAGAVRSLVDAAVEAQIEACVPLAPLHNPPALAVLRAARARCARPAAGGVFDTAFHATLPRGGTPLCAAARAGESARPAPLRLPRPQPRQRDAALRRGRSVARRRRCGRQLPPRRGRQRRGDLRRPQRRHDDGLHAARGPGDGRRAPATSTRACCCGCCARRGLDADGAGATLLNHGIRAARARRHRRHGRHRASRRRRATRDCALAIDVYVHRLRRYVGAMAAALGGLDASPSPAASASTRRRARSAPARGSASSGCGSMPA